MFEHNRESLQGNDSPGLYTFVNKVYDCPGGAANVYCLFWAFALGTMGI